MSKQTKDYKRSLLDNILKTGSQILDKNPAFLDKLTFEGHYPIGAIDYKRSHGPYLVNTNDEEYYDATAYWKTNLIDYKNYSQLKEVAMFLGELSLDAPTVSEMNTPEQAAFTNMLKDFWPAAKHIFTHPSGALAVNDACWTAAAAVAERNGFKPQEMKGVTFEGGFHGRHDRSADATNPSKKVDFKQYENRIVRCSSPIIRYDPFGREMVKETKSSVDRSLRQVEEAFLDKKVAYIILEYPFQAEGGARIIAQDVLKRLQVLCQKHGKFLIVDCVQMGGRVWSTGKNGNVIPFSTETLKYADIITFGKIFRVSGFMAKDPKTLKRGFKSDVMTDHPAWYGSTWVGRADQILSGLAIMEIVLQRKLWKNGLKNSLLILKRLQDLAKSGVVISPRGRPDASYVGWDFTNKELRDGFVKLMREKYHILILPAGEKSIRWGPFLDASTKEIENILDAIEKSSQELSVHIR